MDYPAKEMQCQCGNSIVVDRKRVWCTQCGKPVYHDPKKQRLHKYHNIYMMAIMAAVITFIVYVFIEMIAIPLLNTPMPQ